MASPPPSYRFRKAEHLRRPADFDRVYERKCSARNDWLTVFACANDLDYCRLGLSVSRKVGPAVTRNRLRRLFREGFRLIKHDLPQGLDLVLIPRPGACPTLEEVKNTLAKLVAKLASKIAAQRKN